MPVGAGVAVAGVASGIASSRAAGSAADTAAAGAERSGAQVQAASERARGDVLNFFPAAQQDLLAGAGAAGNLLSQGVTEQQRLFSAGNVGAQGTLQGGFGQVQNALLGIPVNQQAFAPQQIPLSQPLVNPLAQQVTAQPGQQLAGQPAQQPQSPLFGSIGAQMEQRQTQALSGVSSNRDLFSAIGSGELDIPGADVDFWRGVVQGTRGKKSKWGKKGNNFFSSDSIAQATTPQARQAIVDDSGLDKNGRVKLALVLDEFHKLKGTFSPSASEPRPVNLGGQQ